MYNVNRRSFVGGLSSAATLSASGVAFAQKRYDDGASDTEIRIGNTMPYSGPASSYGVIGKVIAAYWNSVNDRGGVNGRRINFISYDDGFSPPKTVEMARRLVEQDRVFCLFSSFGTPTNTVIRKYMNDRKVPQLFVASGDSKWGNPRQFPWTMGYVPSYRASGTIYAKHILATVKDARIAVLMQNDDYGKDYWNGFRAGLGGDAGWVVERATYEVTDPTVDTQVIQMKDSRANVFFSISIEKFAVQSMRRAAELGWRPAIYLVNGASMVSTTMKPAGFENVQGVITAGWLKDSSDRQWDDDAEMKVFRAWMARYVPNGDLGDINYIYAYSAAFLMEQTLKKCGDDLTRETLMRQAASYNGLRVPGLLPGIAVSTSATDYYPVKSVQLQRFKGETWQSFGELIHESL